MSALLEPWGRFTPRQPLSPGFPAPAACHPSPGLLLPSVEVLTQEGGLLPLMTRVRWGSGKYTWVSLIERLTLEFRDKEGAEVRYPTQWAELLEGGGTQPPSAH